MKVSLWCSLFLCSALRVYLFAVLWWGSFIDWSPVGSVSAPAWAAVPLELYLLQYGVPPTVTLLLCWYHTLVILILAFSALSWNVFQDMWQTLAGSAEFDTGQPHTSFHWGCFCNITTTTKTLLSIPVYISICTHKGITLKRNKKLLQISFFPPQIS